MMGLLLALAALIAALVVLNVRHAAGRRCWIDVLLVLVAAWSLAILLVVGPVVLHGPMPTFHVHHRIHQPKGVSQS